MNSKLLAGILLGILLAGLVSAESSDIFAQVWNFLTGAKVEDLSIMSTNLIS